MNITKIRRASANLYLADAISEMLNSLKPHSKKHVKLVTKMKRDLISIRDYGCKLADKEEGRL